MKVMVKFGKKDAYIAREILRDVFGPKGKRGMTMKRVAEMVYRRNQKEAKSSKAAKES